MAEGKTKSVAGMSQAEINIIEEKLSSTHGILPVEIAGHLSNRFDKCLEKIEKVRDELMYVEQKAKTKDDRIKLLGDINKRTNEAKQERQASISKWHKRVLEYIVAEYGDPVKDQAGVVIGYGDRLEVMKNKHLKKYW
jgi:hypothetical protein